MFILSVLLTSGSECGVSLCVLKYFSFAVHSDLVNLGCQHVRLFLNEYAAWIDSLPRWNAASPRSHSGFGSIIMIIYVIGRLLILTLFLYPNSTTYFFFPFSLLSLLRFYLLCLSGRIWCVLRTSCSRHSPGSVVVRSRGLSMRFLINIQTELARSNLLLCYLFPN